MLNIPEEVRKLFFKSSIRKNIRIHFTNGERKDITNENILSESFTFSESLCSGKQFKFGLCESPSIEFTTLNVENIRGKVIEAYCDIDVSELSEDEIKEFGTTTQDLSFPYYSVPFGKYVVDSCQRQANSRRRKVVAYGVETQLESVPNPLEHSKLDGKIKLQYNMPYTFNAAAVVYSNTIVGDKDFFENKKEKETTKFTKYQFSAKSKVKTGGISVNSLYTMRIKSSCIRLNISDSEDASKLYWLKYKEVEELEKIKEEIKKVYEDPTYEGWYGNSCEEVAEEYINSILYPEYSTRTFNEENGLYRLIRINMGDYRCLYPHINCDDSEPFYSGYSYILIPYKFVIEVTEYGKSVPSYSQGVDFRNEDEIAIYEVLGLPQIYLTKNRIKAGGGNKDYYVVENSNIDLKEMTEGFFELQGVFGKSSRLNDFVLFDVGENFGAYPSLTLYPNETLYPRAQTTISINQTYYYSAWYDDEPTKAYDRISVTYKDTDGNEVYACKMIVDDTTNITTEDDEGIGTYSTTDKYQEYSLTDNYLIKNGTFDKGEIDKILELLSEKLRFAQYMPMDIDLVGIPFVEAGDVVRISTADGIIESIILSRTLSGINCLKDNYESKG